MNWGDLLAALLLTAAVLVHGWMVRNGLWVFGQ